ncbi:MAG TPA: amidohydrolase family protein [Hyphomicrobiales bacterium]|nr:amidohydrolase family protein [Hyphomicrobiales bacterium]
MTDGSGRIDCDIHPTVPDIQVLFPYLDDYWRGVVVERGIEGLDSIAYPPNAPKAARADWRHGQLRAGSSLGDMQADALDPWSIETAICNCLYGVQMVMSEDMAAAFARAVNDWLRSEWLDRDARLRGSIVVPLQKVEYAVDEIERCARDPRFVQILVLAMGENPIGRRQYWPVFAAAERHGLALGIHAGSSYHHPVTSLGWPSFYLEDYTSQAQGFQSQLASLVCEGVFAKFPGLKVVLAESGVTWLPGFLWRLSKFWRGLRREVPWVDRSPSEIVRDHVRLTIQPFDVPSAAIAERAIEHLRSDEMLLFASDYPHWQFDGDEPMPAAIPRRLAEKIGRDNPLATYSRLRETVSS